MDYKLFLKKMQNKYYRIEGIVKKYLPIYIDFNCFIILREWWASRDVMKFPKITFNIGNAYCIDKRPISIMCFLLGWKHKYEYTSWESIPVIYVSLFNRYGLKISLQSPVSDECGFPDDHLYWEFMVSYLYEFNKDLYKAFTEWGWSNYKIDMTGNYSISYTHWNWDILTKKGKDICKCYQYQNTYQIRELPKYE